MKFQEAVQFMVNELESCVDWNDPVVVDESYVRQLEAAKIIMAETGIEDQGWVMEYQFNGDETVEKMQVEYNEYLIWNISEQKYDFDSEW